MPIKLHEFGGGQRVAGRTFEYEVRCQDGTPSGSILTCRVVTRTEAQGITDRHTVTRPDPATQRMVPETDWLAVQRDMIRAGVTDWRNVLGLDDQPIPFSVDALEAMAGWIHDQIIGVLTGTEVTGRGPATFPAAEEAPGVVAGPGAGPTVLSAGDRRGTGT